MSKSSKTPCTSKLTLEHNLPPKLHLSEKFRPNFTISRNLFGSYWRTRPHSWRPLVTFSVVAGYSLIALKFMTKIYGSQNHQKSSSPQILCSKCRLGTLFKLLKWWNYILKFTRQRHLCIRQCFTNQGFIKLIVDSIMLVAVVMKMSVSCSLNKVQMWMPKPDQARYRHCTGLPTQVILQWWNFFSNMELIYNSVTAMDKLHFTRY